MLKKRKSKHINHVIARNPNVLSSTVSVLPTIDTVVLNAFALDVVIM